MRRLTGDEAFADMGWVIGGFVFLLFVAVILWATQGIISMGGNQIAVGFAGPANFLIPWILPLGLAIVILFSYLGRRRRRA